MKIVIFGSLVFSAHSPGEKKLLAKVTTRMSAMLATSLDPSRFHFQKGK
jgi:hypothetical protein